MARKTTRRPPRIKITVARAMSVIQKEIAETADVYERLGKKIENFGVRITVVKMVPPTFDIVPKNS